MGTDEEPLRQLNKLRGSKTVILGIGNLLKGDDGTGPLVCQKLLEAGVSTEVIDAGTVPENYIQSIIKKAPQNLLIIDAIDSGASPGDVRIFKPEQLSSLVISTHTLSPRLLVDMVCQSIEVDVYFVGIQPEQTQLGQPITPQVKQAVQKLTDVLVEIFPPSK
ncbi:MAG: hydrogenase maturation peptidase HycI [Planctomycetota bacterium]|nr:MAG: hydrogenase maturation peptidase HycI [Planctomycetota bacterium]